MQFVHFYEVAVLLFKNNDKADKEKEVSSNVTEDEDSKPVERTRRLSETIIEFVEKIGESNL